MLFLSPSPQGCPYGESLRGAFLVEVLVVNGDPRNSIYKVKVIPLLHVVFHMVSLFMESPWWKSLW